MTLSIEESRAAYGFDNFPKDYFDYCLDIGARYGEMASEMADRNASAQIIAYEPCTSSYNTLVANLGSVPRITCVNTALGDGSDLYYAEMPYDDMHMFVPLEAVVEELETAIDPLVTKLSQFSTDPLIAAHAAKNAEAAARSGTELVSTYTVRSVKIADIFSAHSVDLGKKIQVVINIEGGEWSLVGDPGAAILTKCEAISMQLHFKPSLPWRNERFANLPEWSLFHTWVMDTFAATHDINYGHSCKQNGTGYYTINKKH